MCVSSFLGGWGVVGAVGGAEAFSQRHSITSPTHLTPSLEWKK